MLRLKCHPHPHKHGKTPWQHQSESKLLVIGSQRQQTQHGKEQNLDVKVSPTNTYSTIYIYIYVTIIILQYYNYNSSHCSIPSLLWAGESYFKMHTHFRMVVKPRFLRSKAKKAQPGRCLCGRSPEPEWHGLGWARGSPFSKMALGPSQLRAIPAFKPGWVRCGTASWIDWVE